MFRSESTTTIVPHTGKISRRDIKSITRRERNNERKAESKYAKNIVASNR